MTKPWDNEPTPNTQDAANERKLDPLVGTPGPRPAGDPPNPAYPWWCPTCGFWVMGGDVTYEEQHDERNGGCGGYVE